ncbi:hypothetical protein [Halomonas eurihalina]|uniref:hypothetical protein n=1 Tax=Halomonas eurihalina TaxID=42566 RepID=UPI0011EC2E1E|nr:hypothetical protein [Halomonas eurihalina]MDR5860440.1 hypothetical protein [Halomonas eurihalina]
MGGKVAVELDLQQLDLWLMMIGQALRDNDYGFVDWVDQDAFESISQLTYLATTTLLDVGLLAARGRDGIRRLYNQLTQSDRAELIANAQCLEWIEEGLKMGFIVAAPPSDCSRRPWPGCRRMVSIPVPTTAKMAAIIALPSDRLIARTAIVWISLCRNL